MTTKTQADRQNAEEAGVFLSKAALDKLKEAQTADPEPTGNDAGPLKPPFAAFASRQGPSSFDRRLLGEQENRWPEKQASEPAIFARLRPKQILSFKLRLALDPNAEPPATSAEGRRDEIDPSIPERSSVDQAGQRGPGREGSLNNIGIERKEEGKSSLQEMGSLTYSDSLYGVPDAPNHVFKPLPIVFEPGPFLDEDGIPVPVVTDDALGKPSDLEKLQAHHQVMPDTHSHLFPSRGEYAVVFCMVFASLLFFYVNLSKLKGCSFELPVEIDPDPLSLREVDGNGDEFKGS